MFNDKIRENILIKNPLPFLATLHPPALLVIDYKGMFLFLFLIQQAGK